MLSVACANCFCKVMGFMLQHGRAHVMGQRCKKQHDVPAVELVRLEESTCAYCYFYSML